VQAAGHALGVTVEPRLDVIRGRREDLLAVLGTDLALDAVGICQKWALLLLLAAGLGPALWLLATAL